ncbi:MAG: membrane protease YdiL (CAAX protease family) [Bacteroidia bacterium]|jgi:membrane protease YdiL (CAAX protease family)
MKKVKKSTLFIGLTFAGSWGIAGVYYLFGGSLTSTSGILISVLYMFVPMIMALIIEKGIYKQPVVKPLRIGFKINSWFFIAWLIMPVIAFGIIGVSLLLPETSFSLEVSEMFARFESLMTPEQLEEVKGELESLPIHPVWLMLVQGLIAGFTINAVAGFGEELGWRGFLLREYADMKFWKASIYIGFIWGAWHAPLILQGHNYSAHPIIGVFMMIIWCILLTPLFNYITIKAKSVIATAIMHGTLNAVAGIAILLVTGGNDLTIGFTGLSGFVVLIVTLFVFYVYDKRFAKERLINEEIGKYL